MSEHLPLPSLEVENFRAIRRLRIPEMARVTLFVGRNNVGKTSLLEAARLYLYRNQPSLPLVIYEILRDRTNIPSRNEALSGDKIKPADVEQVVAAVRSLFHGSFDEAEVAPIRIGRIDGGRDALTVSLPWTWRGSGPSNALFLAPDSPVLEFETGSRDSFIPLDWLVRRVPLLRTLWAGGLVMIPATGFSQSRLHDLWDQAVVSRQDPLVEEALRVLVPDLERILLVGDAAARTVLVQVRGLERPMPIQSMGDGVNRVFGVALAMVQARGGAVLIDEVENGLHFTVQDEVWRAIFSVASQLDVQVLATTHSWDAIVGFQYAANQSEEEGMLYRLERDPDGDVRAIAYSEEEVEIAAEQQIEVR